MERAICFNQDVTSETFLPVASAEPGVAIIRYQDKGWHLYKNPVQIIQAQLLDEVKSTVEQAENWADHGGYAVGFLSYEAGPAFDPQIAAHKPSFPLYAWFALYSEPPQLYPELEPAQADVVPTQNVRPNTSDHYRRAFTATKEALANGSIYQANITFKIPIQSTHHPIELFSSLCGVNPPPYATYIHAEDWHVVSLSPELFFTREADRIEMRPMKGTAPNRGTKQERTQLANHLKSDPKTISENIMIVDMVRNDLGRFAEIGSVQTPQLLTVEEHRTVLQVTSTVTAEFSGPTAEIFANTFPPASVTGAPKIAATQHIAAQEIEPRGVYCGAIGYLGPDKEATFNVGIRTALFDASGTTGDYGVGSGIVWDSELESEFEECLSKSRVIKSPAPEWAILESISDHASPEEVQQHLNRLQASASHFQVRCNLEHILKALNHPREPKESGFGKLRLTLNRFGTVKVEHQESLLPRGNLKACLARRPIGSNEPRYRFKTTSRTHLQVHLTENSGCDEVILYNERNEVASFCNGNLVAMIDDQWVTPPVESGCLAGIGLWKFSQVNDVHVRPISVSELQRATRLILTNAVVGAREVELIESAF